MVAALLFIVVSVPQLIAQPPVTDRQKQLAVQAQSQLVNKDFGLAIETYNSLLAEVSDPRAKGEVLALIGEAYRYGGDLVNSLRYMEKAVVLLPNNSKVQSNLGLLYESQNDKVHARQAYEKALSIDSNNPLVLNNLAYLLTGDGGDLDLALSYARSAKEKLPEFVEISDTIGWIYLKKNLLTDAAYEFQLAASKAPGNAEYRYHFAMALNRQGKLKEATRECQAAMDDNPAETLKAQIISECAGQLSEKK